MNLYILLPKETVRNLYDPEQNPKLKEILDTQSEEYKKQIILSFFKFQDGVNAVYATARPITDEELDKIADMWAQSLLICGALAINNLNQFSDYLKERMK